MNSQEINSLKKKGVFQEIFRLCELHNGIETPQKTQIKLEVSKTKLKPKAYDILIRHFKVI